MNFRHLVLALLLGLLRAGTASAQVVIRAQVGSPYRYYNRPYYAPRPYGYYPPVAAPVVVVPPPVYYAPPPPVYYAPRPRFYHPHPRYYGRGYGRRW